MKEKNKATGGVWKVMGNLRFPLDKTYHGCPYLLANAEISWLKSRKQKRANLSWLALL